MTNQMVMIYGCRCHEGQIYILNEDNIIVKVIRGEIPTNWKPDRRDYSYKKLDNINDLVSAILT